MDLLASIIYGTVQGATEFLPVSSSGHLVILHRLWPYPAESDLAFDAVLHLGTLLAVVIFLWPELWKLVRTLFRPSAWHRNDPNFRTIGLIIASTIPAGLIGFLAEPLLESWRDPRIVAANLAIFGLAMLWADRVDRPKTIVELSGQAALLIGLAQALALVPGVSRSSITIIAGLLLGLKRTEAVKYSFLLSIPVISGAGIFKLIDLFALSLSGPELAAIAVAGLAAFVSGWLAVKYLLRYVASHDLRPFVWYRLVLAAVIAIWFVFT